MSHLPVVADPAHGTGKWSLVTPMAMAAVAAGADAVMVEVHPDPTEAWSDGAQSLTSARFAEMMKALAPRRARPSGARSSSGRAARDGTQINRSDTPDRESA